MIGDDNHCGLICAGIVIVEIAKQKKWKLCFKHFVATKKQEYLIKPGKWTIFRVLNAEEYDTAV